MSGPVKAHVAIGQALTQQRGLRIKLLGAAIAAPRETFGIGFAVVTWLYIGVGVFAFTELVRTSGLPTPEPGTAEAMYASFSRVLQLIGCTGLIPLVWKIIRLFYRLQRNRQPNIGHTPKFAIPHGLQTFAVWAVTAVAGAMILFNSNGLPFMLASGMLFQIITGIILPAASIALAWFLFSKSVVRRNNADRRAAIAAHLDAQRRQTLQTISRVAERTILKEEYREFYNARKADHVRRGEYTPAGFDLATSQWTPEDWSIFYDSVTSKFLTLSDEDENGNRVLTVAVPDGKTQDAVRAISEPLADALQLVRADVLSTKRGVVDLNLAKVDILARTLPENETPVLHLTEAERNNPYHRLVVGIDSRGQAFRTSNVARKTGGLRTITVGNSGAGKSSIFHQLMIQAVTCPAMELYLIDGKASEMRDAKPYAKAYAVTADQVKALLKRIVEEEIPYRSDVLGANINKPDRISNALNWFDDGVPTLVLFWDELMAVNGPISAKEWGELMSLLSVIVSIGRSLNITIHLCGQTFPTEILPDRIRSQFSIVFGGTLSKKSQSTMANFAEDDAVRPDLIKGNYDEDEENYDTVGQFAVKGEATSTYVKSYFVSQSTAIRYFDELVARGELQLVP